MKSFRQSLSRDGPRPFLKPGLFLIFRKNNFRIHVQIFFWIDRKASKAILWILIYTAEPGLMGNGHNSRHAGDLIFIAQGQRLDERDFVPNQKAIRLCKTHTSAKGLFDSAQKAVQQKRHKDRKQREAG